MKPGGPHTAAYHQGKLKFFWPIAHMDMGCLRQTSMKIQSNFFHLLCLNDTTFLNFRFLTSITGIVKGLLYQGR